MSFIDNLLSEFRQDKINQKTVIEEIKKFYGYSDIGIAKVDDYRAERTGVGEFIYGLSKGEKTLSRIVAHYIKNKRNFLITKINEKKIDYLKKKYPNLHFSKRANMAWIRYKKEIPKLKSVGIVSAGTSDMPIVMESFITLGFLGYSPTVVTDIGVSAIQRVMSRVDMLRDLNILICIAGMEGALPTVLAGLTGRPIVAVPTSTGYGISKDGISTLHSILSSCAPNISTVNIDNGFGAPCFTHSVLNLVK